MSIPDTENNFDFYLRFAKPLVLNLSEPSDRALAAAWVQKLRDDKVGTEKLRSDYLKLLLFVLQRKKLIGVFSEHPSQFEKLEEFPETNLHDVAKELLEAEEEYRRQKLLTELSGPSGDSPPYSTEHSADLLEYSAAQDIPNFGVHAYYAISNEPLPNWEKTDKAVFPRGPPEKVKSLTISRISTATTEPTLDSDSSPVKESDRKSRAKSKSKSRSRSRSKSKSKKDKSDLTFDEDEMEDAAKITVLTTVQAKKTKRKALGDTPPSQPLGAKHKEDESRAPPTWGSNLIGVSEPPVREITTEPLSDAESDPFLLESQTNFFVAESVASSGSSRYPSVPYKTPSPRKTSPDRETCVPCGSSMPYSPQFPQGEADPFFLETPPSFLEAESIPSSGSSRYPSLPYRTPSPRRQSPDRDISQPCDPCGSPLSQREAYSPQLPQGSADAFFLESPPSFLEASSMSSSSSSRASSLPPRSPSPRPCPAVVGSEEAIERQSIDNDLDAFDRMIAEYEQDDYGAGPSSPYQYPPRPPSPYQSPQRSPAPCPASSPAPCPVSPARSPTPQQKPAKKIIKKKKVIKKKVPSKPGGAPQEAPDNRSGMQRPPPRKSKTTIRTVKRTYSKPTAGLASESQIIRPETQAGPCPGTSRIAAPGSRIAAPCPGGSRIPAFEGSRISAAGSQLPCPGGSRIPAPGGSRIPAPGGSRIPAPGGSRIPAPGSQLPCPGGSRIPAPGGSRIPAPGGSRIPAPGGSRIPAPGGSRIPAPGGQMLRPGEAEIFTSTKISEALPERPYSPLFPEGEADPFFLETPPSFLDEASMPSSGSSRYPSLPYRTPPPQGTSPCGICGSPPSLPYGTPSPRPASPGQQYGFDENERQYSPIFQEEEADPFFLETPPSFLDEASMPSSGSSRYPSLPYRTPPPQGASPCGICGSPPSLPYRTPSPRPASPRQQYDANELEALGLEEGDLQDDIFNLDEVNNMNLSEISTTSEIEYEERPEFNVDDRQIDEELDEWDRQIAALEAENAEDIALYGTPDQKTSVPSPARSSVTNLSAEALPMILPGSPAAQDIIDAANKYSAQQKSYASPDRSPGWDFEEQERIAMAEASPVQQIAGARSPMGIPAGMQDPYATANQQYQHLVQHGSLEDEYTQYQQRYRHRRPDMPRTPPVFSKFAPVMGAEAQKVYDPSEFGEIGEIDWQPAEQFFEGKQSFSPRIGERGSEVKRLISGVGRQPEAEQFLEQESEPDLEDIENEFETLTTGERSPAATREDVAKEYSRIQTEIAFNKQTMPADAGLPITTPRRSPSPRRPGRSLRVEMEGKEVSFEIPSFESPSSTKRDELFLESPPQEYYGSPGQSPLSAAEINALPDPHGLPKRARFSPVKPTEILKIYEAAAMKETVAKTEKQYKALDAPLVKQQEEQIDLYVKPERREMAKRVSQLVADVPDTFQSPHQLKEWDLPQVSQQQSGILEETPPDLGAQYLSPSSPVCAATCPSRSQSPKRSPTPKRSQSPRRSPQPTLFEAAEPTGLEAEEPPEDMYQSPCASPQRPQAPGSPPESPFSLRCRLLGAPIPDYYSQEQMQIPMGGTVSKHRVMERRSPAPTLHRVRELPDNYDEENVPFLAQVEAAKRLDRRGPRRMQIAAPCMDTVRESPVTVPDWSQYESPPPEDLFGAQGPVNWEMSPSVLDRSIPGGLPSPMRPPTQVPGWSTPPHLKAPSRVPRAPILPALTDNVRVSPGLRDVYQEMPPSGLAYSPPPLSPGEYPRPLPAAPCPGRSPRASPPSPAMFDATLGEETPPEALYGSPTTPPRRPPSPDSSPESPFSLRCRLLGAPIPDYYSQEQMEIPMGGTVSKHRVMERRSPAPSLHRVREIPDNYDEENVPFLAQVEAAKRLDRRGPRRMQIAAPCMETVRESPITVPDWSQYESPPPEDLFGAQGPVNWEMSPSVLDRSIPGGLPSPMRLPTQIPGWSTPPHLKAPPRAPCAPLLPAFTNFAGVRPGLRDISEEMPPSGMAYSPPPLSPGQYQQRTVSAPCPGRSPRTPPPRSPRALTDIAGVRPGLRDISEEMPPPGMAYSPPPLSPGQYPQPKASAPCPGRSPRTFPPRALTPVRDVFDAAAAEGLGEEAPPEGLYDSPCFPPITPPRRPPPLSPVESPFTLRCRLWSSLEPDYYSKEQMPIPIGRTSGRQRVMKRRSAAPCLGQVPEDSPMASQGEPCRPPRGKQPEKWPIPLPSRQGSPSQQYTGTPQAETTPGKGKRKKIRKITSRRKIDFDEKDPNTQVITEVTETEESDEPIEPPAPEGGLKNILQNLERRYADLPEYPQTLPDDLIGAQGPIDWQAQSNELDRPVPGGLRSPLKPPTVVPGWSTPPHLRKPERERSPQELKFIPGLRDDLVLERPPPELDYSPASPSASPQSSTFTRRSPVIRTRKVITRTHIPAQPPTISPESSRQSPRSPQTLPSTSRQAGDVFKDEPQFLVVEMPPDEFMPAGSPPSGGRQIRFADMPSDDTVDFFEEHERSAERSPIQHYPPPPCGGAPGVSPSQRLQNIRNLIQQQYSQLDEPRTPPIAQGSPKQRRHSGEGEPCHPCTPEGGGYDTSLQDFEEAEKSIYAGAPVEQYPKTRVPGPSRAVIDQMIKTAGVANKQYQDMQRSPTWLESVQQKVYNVPDPHLPRRRPLVPSPTGALQSPEWSPKLPQLHPYADQLDEEFVPQGVWGYDSPKTPPRSPERPAAAPPRSKSPPDIFDVEPVGADYLDQILPPEMLRSPTSPPTPPCIDDYYTPHTPPSPGSPYQFAESVQSHQYTDRYYDKNRKKMTGALQIKNKVVPVSGSKRPTVSPIRESIREDSPVSRTYSSEGDDVDGDTTEEIFEETTEEIIEELPPSEPIGLDFESPPRPPRLTIPKKYSYVPDSQYKDGLMNQSPPQFYASPEMGPGIYETTPEGYDFSPPPMSPEESPCSPCSPYMGFTPPPLTPPENYGYGSPSPAPYFPESPIDSPSFQRSIREHEYTEGFFDRDRPKTFDMVRSGNRMVNLSRISQPPPLDYIEERYEESPAGVRPGPCGSPNYDLPRPNYYGSPGREYIRTPARREPARESPNRVVEEKTVTIIESDDPWDSPYNIDIPDTIPFAGQPSPTGSLDTSLIPSDLDASYVEEDMSGFKWMG